MKGAFVQRKERCNLQNILPSRNVVLFDLSMRLSFLRVIVCTHFVYAKGS